ncbi:MAG: DEAD/DEAH box helicase family protein [Pasteurella sp.]|nr:DEAD/DEAH box helicase family protein [Pasteurella sp.]
MQLILPELVIQKLVIGKNKVSQKVIKSETINIDSIKVKKGYTIVISNNIEYCLVIKPENTPEKYEYAIKVNKQATEPRLINGNIKLRKWVKHPLNKQCSTSDVVASWDNQFTFLEEIPNKQNGLREPQIACLYSILSHLKISNDIATAVMPTGTGKTETMLSTLIVNKCNKLLVIVPSDALRTQLEKKFLELGLLKQFNLISEKCIPPFVGILKERFKSSTDLTNFIDCSNVIITTMPLLSGFTEKHLNILNDKLSYTFIDEAHHIEATSWKRVKNKIKDCKIIQFTATPFRNDQQRIDGKIIFNFSLRKAQEQGYFKPINFEPIREYDPNKADKVIADKAVGILKNDLQNGYNHFLMARCKSKKRSEEVYQHYKIYTDLNPVVIHSDTPKKQEVLKRIVNGEHKIVVAVNMLGEGFDLPQLKIAAFHDIRKSLPITLQFAGRFTRTSIDSKLGNASFIANLADVDTEDELSELYSQDADWNILLSSASEENINEQVDFHGFIDGFQNIKNSSIPFQNIRFAMSSEVYKNSGNKFDLSKFNKGIKNYNNLEYCFHDIDNKTNTLVLITAQKTDITWVNYKEVYSLNWRLIVCYYDVETKLLFIHSSDKGFYKSVAEAILFDKQIPINKKDIFKSFYNIDRRSLQNVGLKEYLNHHIRFRMLVGSDIEEAISVIDKQKGERAFAFGNGYENGEKVSLGCSYKGRVWSYQQGDLRQFISWAKNIAYKLVDENIDPDEILKDCLIPKFVNIFPNSNPIRVDWDEQILQNPLIIETQNGNYTNHLLSMEIEKIHNKNSIEFSIVTPNEKINLEYQIFQDKDNNAAYRIFNKSQITSNISFKGKKWDIEEFFNYYPVRVWFADGSSICGYEYVELKQIIKPYPTEKLLTWDWSGVDLSKESQKVSPLEKDSIQYHVIQKLKKDNYDIIYDDDGSGEIADVITIKEYNDKIAIELYHLKYAKSGNINKRIDNFYEVCGQAQKSVHWKHEKGSKFFEHLLKRKSKASNGKERSRIEQGTEQDLERLLRISKNSKPMVFDIYIVQPSLSKLDVSNDIMMLLGVTDNYLKDIAGINLQVIVSP